METLLLPCPWDLHLNDNETYLLQDESIVYSISGNGSPRIISPIDVLPRYGPRQKPLPRTSFPFLWNGQKCSAYNLPTDNRPHPHLHDFDISLTLPKGCYDITQRNVIGRPSGSQESTLGRILQSFIEWQVHCFRELTDDDSTIGEFEEKARNVVRRSWKSVRLTWVNYDKKDAMMALIVKLAQDRDLLEIFLSIVRSPRKILLRYRENTKVDRIQELDAACIRDYARRPGRTFMEKAGSRQELLAVRRKDSLETLENKVFAWTINEMYKKALDYQGVNKHHLQAGSSRVKTVSQCGRQCQKWINTETLQAISFEQLQHPTPPNYSLQMDDRYRHVYKTYQKLVKEKFVLDDAWEWQRTLWAESARQLLGCALTEIFKEEYVSTAYYRFENENGIWTEPPITPGPFETKKGLCIPIDSRDVQMNPETWMNSTVFPFAPYIGTLGCDQVLFWPEINTIVIVWFFYWTGPTEELAKIVDNAGKAMQFFSGDVARYTRQSYRCFGLLLMTDRDNDVGVPQVDIETWPKTDGELELVGLRIPIGIDRADSKEFKSLIEDFKSGIDLAVNQAMNQ